MARLGAAGGTLRSCRNRQAFPAPHGVASAGGALLSSAPLGGRVCRGRLGEGRSVAPGGEGLLPSGADSASCGFIHQRQLTRHLRGALPCWLPASPPGGVLPPFGDRPLSSTNLPSCFPSYVTGHVPAFLGWVLSFPQPPNTGVPVSSTGRIRIRQCGQQHVGVPFR